MVDRAVLGQLRDLACLQGVLTAHAAVELAEARDAERAAEEAAREDVRRVGDMAEHWYRHLAGPVMPERGVALAVLLVERERAAQRSGEQAQLSRDGSADRERQWRSANAAERATLRLVGDLERQHARKAEERATSALADRTTVDWMRR